MCVTDPKFPNAGPGGFCFGDSGGPTYTKHNSNEMLQHGIPTYMRGCSGRGNTQWIVNLKSYFPFIQQYVNEKYGRWNEIYDHRD